MWGFGRSKETEQKQEEISEEKQLKTSNKKWRKVLLPIAIALPLYGAVSIISAALYSSAEKIEIFSSCEPNVTGQGTHAQVMIRKYGDPGQGIYVVNKGGQNEDYYNYSRPLLDGLKISFEGNKPNLGARVAVYAGIPSEANSPPPFSKGKQLAGVTIPVCS